MRRSVGGGAIARSRGRLFWPLAAAWLSATPAAATPPIRTGVANPVPACATPDRLMAFLTARNPGLDRRFANIARDYKQWGEAWRVRWDYAFFQMAIETNFLKFRRPDGRRGDVHEAQNNFAGLGATGGGVPGDRFADVTTGVHAQIQHLVAFSGERLARPIAPRTALKQDDIVALSLRLNRPVTFGDLARRWAADRHYARSIDIIAGQFNAEYCAGANSAATRITPAPQPALRRGLFPPPSGLGGPKPSALAGPETEPPGEVLPWATPVARPAPATKPAVAPKPAPAQKPEAKRRQPAAPVRTLWSRQTPSANPQASLTNAIAAAPNTPPAAPQVAVAPVEQSEESSVGFLLPWFRIAPAAPPGPSRLGGPVPKLEPPAPTAWKSPDDVPAAAGCRVLKASYGGRKTLLVRATIDGELRLTALTVLDGFENTMFETYARAAAPGADIIGEYENQDHALADARANCPGGG
jgi:hypothetical protein